MDFRWLLADPEKDRRAFLFGGMWHIESVTYSKDNLNELPKAPGVYQFYNAEGKLLYVGKAKSLQDRVRSYFRGTVERSPQVLEMLPRVAAIQVLETPSEIEALLLESRLIRQHQPPANSLGKDAKSFLCLILFDEEWPRLQFARQRDLETIREGKLFGTKIKTVYGPFIEAGQVRAAMKVIRKILPYRDCSPSKFERYHKLERPCLYGFLNLCPAPCVGRVLKEDYLKRIRQVDRLLMGKRELVERELTRQMNRASKAEQFEVAGRLRDQIKGLEHLREVSLLEHERAVPDQSTLRIEAYDISLTSGTNAVGSMVVFSNDRPNVGQYRRFRIKGKNDAGDLDLMAEVLRRRLARSSEWGRNLDDEKARWPAPDLLVIDGGKEHLKVARRVLREYRLDVPVMAVAKGAARKKAEPFFSDEGQIRRLLQAFDFEKLIRQLRDEAHRFAITYHRNLRSRKAFASIFDQIPGIGPASKQALIMHFGSALAIKKASHKELAEVVGKHKAQVLREYLDTK